MVCALRTAFPHARPLRQHEPATLWPFEHDPRVKSLTCITVGALEARYLAVDRPIVWSVMDGAFELCVILRLLPHQKADCAGMLTVPLALQAYPLTYEPLPDPSAILLHYVEPWDGYDTGTGRALFTPQGFSSEGVARIDALKVLAQGRASANEVGSWLAARDLLKPLDLNFEVAGEALLVRDMLYATPDALATPHIEELEIRFGSWAPEMIYAAQVSLHTVRDLLVPPAQAEVREA